MYRFLFHHLLSRIDSELIHDLTIEGLSKAGQFTPMRGLMSSMWTPDTEGMSIKALGYDFAHPLGLAAGFDKDGRAIHAIGALGFSSVEIGTVTPRPQPGNPRPRIFRVIEDEALINRMGFPSTGMQAVVKNLRTRRRSSVPIGVSIGKNRDTTLAEAHQDYCTVLEHVYPYADFFVVNVSSPNTPGLQQLQSREFLTELLSQVLARVQSLTVDAEPKPVLLKLSPDMAMDEIDTALELALAHGVRGIIATNTTTARLHTPEQVESGGLSGRPLRARSTEIIHHIFRSTQGKLCIVGVGGVFSGSDIWEKMCAGASLVQVYTGLIYEGPMFVKTAMSELQRRMRQEGINSLSQLVGMAHFALR
jgi:dihydroorotate dehydrogenase